MDYEGLTIDYEDELNTLDYKDQTIISNKE